VILGVHLTHQQIPTTPETQELYGSSQDHKGKSKRLQKIQQGHKLKLKPTESYGPIWRPFLT
jgi:hypothetical protein